MTDYLGNPLKEGMIIQVIETIPFITSMRVCWLNTETGDVSYGEEIKTPEKVWRVKGEYNIVSLKGNLYYECKEGDITMRFALSLLDFGRQPGDIITIKGLSDVVCN